MQPEGHLEETPKAQSGDFTSCRIHCCVLIQAMCTHASGKQSRVQSKEAKSRLPTGQRLILCFRPSPLSIPSTRGLFLPPLPTLQRSHSSRTLNFILFFASSVAVVKLCLCFVISLAMIFSCCSLGRVEGGSGEGKGLEL